jgi:hypothetical protein
LAASWHLGRGDVAGNRKHRRAALIGQEILEHYQYRGQIMRVLFTAQDSQTISQLHLLPPPLL